MNTKNIKFDGLDAIEITTPRLRLVAVYGTGPRIAFLGKDGGENLLYWDPTFSNARGDWKIRGGHRVWNTRPGADESEDSYGADNEPCTVTTEGDALVLTGAEHPFMKTRRGFKIRQIDDLTFEITNFLTNTGDMLYSGGVWSITCSNPKGGKKYGIPLGDRSQAWDLIQILFPRAWAGHNSRLDDPQITYNQDFLLVDPQGVETKRMVMAPQGVIAWTWPEKKMSFIKKAEYDQTGQYPLNCNLAFYVGPDNFMLEMEAMGPMQTLLPGQTVSLKETWKITDQVLQFVDPTEIGKLFA
jgi:hypothetical protein